MLQLFSVRFIPKVKPIDIEYKSLGWVGAHDFHNKINIEINIKIVGSEWHGIDSTCAST